MLSLRVSKDMRLHEIGIMRSPGTHVTFATTDIINIPLRTWISPTLHRESVFLNAKSADASAHNVVYTPSQRQLRIPRK